VSIFLGFQGAAARYYIGGDAVVTESKNRYGPLCFQCGIRGHTKVVCPNAKVFLALATQILHGQPLLSSVYLTFVVIGLSDKRREYGRMQYALSAARKATPIALVLLRFASIVGSPVISRGYD
jgi:hypothetical protein